jgi:uncharacterized protein YjbJ (UPF0337 family)
MATAPSRMAVRHAGQDRANGISWLHARDILQRSGVSLRGSWSGTGNDPASFQLPAQRNNAKERAMGSTTDKLKGYANEAAGKAKQKVGNIVGNDKMQAEGATQQTLGELQKKVREVKGAVKDAADKIADTANDEP